MENKTFEFADNSKITFEYKGDMLYITLQARHLGKEIKFTSATAYLDAQEVEELANWLDMLLGKIYG